MTGKQDLPDQQDGGFAEDFFVGSRERDAIQIVREASKPALPKRFYKQADVSEQDGGFAILLDGRPVRTPRGQAVRLPTRAAAALAAGEWSRQGDQIDPATMPVTRLINSALDGVAQDIAAVAADIVKYSGSDLVCYRAADPRSLVQAQAAAWDPVLAFARESLNAEFALAEGVMFVEQPESAIGAVREAVDAIAAGPDAALRIAALHVITTLTGSALLALGIYRGAFSRDQAWAGAHVDEDEQMRLWGFDAEALRRRANRFEDMQAACALLDSLAPP